MMSGLAERDALLSRLLGQDWPHEPLLVALQLPQPLDVLDVGAGEGRLLNFLANRGHQGRRVGIDPQPGDGVRQGSAEALSFPDQSLDVVFMIRMLSHCADPLKALAEAQRVLRPGGQLIVAVQGVQHLQNLREFAGQAPPSRGAEDDVQDILNTSGLAVTRRDVTLNISLSLHDATDLLDTYGIKADLSEVPFPLADTLHLVIFQMKKGPVTAP